MSHRSRRWPTYVSLAESPEEVASPDTIRHEKTAGRSRAPPDRGSSVTTDSAIDGRSARQARGARTWHRRRSDFRGWPGSCPGACRSGQGSGRVGHHHHAVPAHAADRRAAGDRTGAYDSRGRGTGRRSRNMPLTSPPPFARRPARPCSSSATATPYAAIVAALGGPRFKDFCEPEYDNLIVMVLDAESGVRTVRTKYGAATPVDQACASMR